MKFGKKPLTETAIINMIPDVASQRDVRKVLGHAKKFQHATVVNVANELEKQVKRMPFPERKREAAIKTIREAKMPSIK